MKILQKKKLERVITDIQLEQIMSKCLLSSDQSEYFREWAKEKGTSVLSSTFLEGDDEEVPLDFNKTISDEIDFGTMEVKREFLTRFLVRKQLELMEILASRRTRSYTRREVGSNTKFVKFRDKMFQMTEVDEDEDITEEILNEYIFLTTIGGKTKGPCPIVWKGSHQLQSFFLSKIQEHESRGTKGVTKHSTQISTITMYMVGIRHYVHGYWPQRSGQRQSVNQCNSLTNIHLKVEVGRDSNRVPYFHGKCFNL